MKKTERINAVMRVLTRRYRGKVASEKEDAFCSILFTLLSARTRDEQTEVAYRKLIARYPNPRALAAAKVAAVTPLLRSIGLYRAKAKNVVALSKKIIRDFNGRVPPSIEEMVTLPGVGRKTANCVMVYAFGKPAVCVDTHVHRIVNRLGWVRTKDPLRTEVALRRVLPERWWLRVNHTLVLFGRDLCTPGRPRCWKCPVRQWCRYPRKTPAPGAVSRGEPS